MAELQGVFPILPTIFQADGAIDEAGMANVFEYLLGAGAAGVVFPAWPASTTCSSAKSGCT